MKKLLSALFLISIFLTSQVSASTINVKIKANEQEESVAVQKGDVVHLTWTSESSEPIIGCKGNGAYNVLTMNGQEFVGASLPASGSADLTVTNWDKGGTGMSIYCWLGNWPQNAQFGSNIAQDEILLLDKSIGKIPNGKIPSIIALNPTSGPIGTTVQIIGSGFTNASKIIFVGSTNPVSGSDANTISPVSGESQIDNVIPSGNGNILPFTIPSKFARVSNEKSGQTSPPNIVPGIYYFVVETENGKTGVSYFKVTNSNESTGYIPPVTSFFINANLKLRDLGPEVVKLQSLLAKDTSLYPEGLITGYYGSLTQKAVQRFQCKHGISCSGTPETNGYGLVDLKTRQKMEEVFGNSKPNDTQSNGDSLKKRDVQNKISDLTKQIQQLQTQLQSLTQ